jgi:hypothetical protein
MREVVATFAQSLQIFKVFMINTNVCQVVDLIDRVPMAPLTNVAAAFLYRITLEGPFAAA